MLPSLLLFLLASELRPALAATAEQWRTRSIYQIITDRFALSPGAVVNECVLSQRTWCGGTWNSIRENLDYVQNAGFTAISISPVNQNYQGPRTAYGDPYHGYWSADLSQLNDRFGTADDLKALSAEVHRRNMYLMVDVVVNNVMSTSITNIDFSTYMFKDKSLYHPYCQVDSANVTSEQQCWLGDTTVPLPDVDTENPEVVSKYSEWIADLVHTYSIDGLRIVAAQHVKKSFWPEFAKSAGVFCMGEVSNPAVPNVAEFQGPDALDSTLNYPLYYALVAAFGLPGPQNMSALTDVLSQSKTTYTVGHTLNDLPRWHSLSVDPRVFSDNAMTFTFLSDGRYNREPLWPSNYNNTSSYQLISTLNQSDHLIAADFLTNTTDWASQDTKGDVITILTNIGTPPQNLNIAFKSPWDQGTVTIECVRCPSPDVIGCRQFVVASGGYLEVEYTKGGVSVVLAESELLKNSGLCGTSRKMALQAALVPPLYPHGFLCSLSWCFIHTNYYFNFW
ncbi:glycoside hydrolase family 13 protein [Mycena leptocephala]|nr:glycoside hydrolase family 13 protein [Mycena leptocephala]